MAQDACYEKIALSLDEDKGCQNLIYFMGINGFARAEWLSANEMSIDGCDPKNSDEANHLRFTVIGLIFLAAGVIPGFYFGRYGALLLLKKISGGAVGSTLLVKAMVIAGIGAGIICAAAMSVVIACLLCTAVSYLTAAPCAKK